MKKIIFKFFLISLFTCLSFFSIDKVYAMDNAGDGDWSITGVSMSINDSVITQSNYLSYANGVNLNFKVFGTFFYDKDNQGTWVYPSTLWERNTFCVTGILGNGNSGTNTLQTRFYYTNIKCLFTNGVTGHIVFNVNRINVNSPNSGSANIYHEFSTQNNGSSISWYGNEYSTTQFPIYEPTDTVIQQNDTIINKLQTLIDQGGSGVDGQIVYQQKETNSKLDQANKNLEDSNKLAKDKLEQDKKHHEEIMDDDTSGANSEAESFFSGFTTETHGLTSIITAPLSTIEYLASSTCSPLKLDIPFVDKTLNMPCLRPIYKKHFGLFINVYDTFTFGFVSYWVLVKIFALVKEAKDPEKDNIEVMDL